MTEQHKKKSLSSLRFLYGLGLVFIIVGLVDLFGSGNLVPEALRFTSYELTLILLGIALLLPSMFYALKPEPKYEVPRRVRHRRH